MNIATATPAEIDFELNRIDGEVGQLDANIERWGKVLDRAASATPGSYESHYYTPEKVAEAEREIVAASAARADLMTEQEPLNARYAAERWNRYYLVTNTNGHVHTSTRCRTCFVTTQFAWLTEQSGMSHDDLTDLAGELSCAECFPNLPPEIMAKKTRIEDPAKRKTRLEREAAKAERDAKKLAKALLPDGSTLRVEIGIRERFSSKAKAMVPYVETKTLETLAQARTWLTDSYWYSNGYSYPAAARQTIAEAVAAKEGKTVETVLAEAQKRAAKRK
jgi:hypothetical protein